MSLLLKDKVWSMLSDVAKRGVYPLHGYKLGIFRIPVSLIDDSLISSIEKEIKKNGFKTDRYADRIYIAHSWTEEDIDAFSGKKLKIDLDVTVEIVTGDVIDIIYQIIPLEKFGDPYWVKNYKKKADNNAKMVIDTIIRNTTIGDKLISNFQKSEKLSLEQAIEKLNTLTPLVINPKLRDANPPPQSQAASASPQQVSSSVSQPSISSVSTQQPQTSSADPNTTISLTGNGTDYSTEEGPIDVDFKSKRKNTGKFKGINVWGPVDGPGQLGIWGDNVCVDFDICIGDGACIEACPVNVYEWLQTPGHPGSEQKPFMAREKDCIFCLACENVCPPNAIKIFEKK